MESKLFDCAAFARNDKHIKISVPIRGKSDPLSIWRKAGIHISGFVGGNALYVFSVFVGSPDIGQIGKNDAAMVVMRIANEFGLTGGRPRRRAKRQQKGESVDFFHRFSF